MMCIDAYLYNTEHQNPNEETWFSTWEFIITHRFTKKESAHITAMYQHVKYNDPRVIPIHWNWCNQKCA